MVIIAASWGFFEGFSYVVIAERVNRLFPVRRVWLNAGAAAGGVICLVAVSYTHLDVYKRQEMDRLLTFLKQIIH